MADDNKKWWVIVKTVTPGFYKDNEDRDAYGPYKRKWFAALVGFLISRDTCHIKREFWLTEDMTPDANPFRRPV